jgi:hypothetical protein
VPYLQAGAIRRLTEEEMLEDYLKVRGVGDLVAAATVLVVVTMVFHYQGYALVVGWQVLSYFTAQDYIRLSAMWLPAVPVFAVLLLFERIRRHAANKRFIERVLPKSDVAKVREKFLTTPGPVDIEGLVDELRTSEDDQPKNIGDELAERIVSQLKYFIYRVPRKLRKSSIQSTRYILRKKIVGDREPTEFDGWVIASCVPLYVAISVYSISEGKMMEFVASFFVLATLVINRSSWYNMTSEESHLIYKTAPVILLPLCWMPMLIMISINGLYPVDIILLTFVLSYWMYGVVWVFKIRIPLLKRVSNMVYNSGATAIALLFFAVGFGFYSAHSSVTKESPSVAVHVNYHNEPVKGNILINLSNTLLLSEPGSTSYTAISQTEIRSIELLGD